MSKPPTFPRWPRKPKARHVELEIHPVGRRAFLAGSSCGLAAGMRPAFGRRLLGYDKAKGEVKFGCVTGMHYSDKLAAGNRYYREKLDKLAEAAGRFEKETPAFVVELVDLIAADAVESKLKCLTRIDKEFAALAQERHDALGMPALTGGWHTYA